MSEPKGIGGMADRDLDVVIVGAGFAGLYMLHRLRGMGFAARIIEAASGVGGT
jgi:cyclohexanone monooxygenase